MKKMTLLMMVGLMILTMGCGTEDKASSGKGEAPVEDNRTDIEKMSTEALQKMVDSFKPEMMKAGSELSKAKSTLRNESEKLSDVEKEALQAVIKKCEQRLKELNKGCKPYREELQKRKATTP